jgi:hypothetical protein
MAARSAEHEVRERARVVQGSSYVLTAWRRVNLFCRPTLRGIEPLFHGSERMAALSELPGASVSLAWQGSERDCQGKHRSWQGREVSSTMCEVAVTGSERDVTVSEVAVYWKDLRRMSADATTTGRRYDARSPAEMATATRFVDPRSERVGTGSRRLG